MSDNILKSFLVSIGFAVDASSEQRMKKALRDQEDLLKNREKLEAEYERKQKARQEQAAKSMKTLVGIATTAAVALEGFTIAMATYATHVAARLEAMAYASERTRSSVQDLRIFSQAVSQLGGTAGGALSDLENFAARLRSNPQGYTAFLRSVGVQARDAQGNIRGAAELYKEFRRSVGGKSYEQQLLYAQEMGISEQTWRATDPSKMAGEEAAQRAKYARMNYDPDKATDDAKKLQHALRDMFDSMNIIGEKTVSKIFADVGDNLKTFTTFLEQHGDQIAEILSKVAQMVLAVSQALLELLTSEKVKAGMDWLLGMFGHVDEGSGKWVADTEKIKSALEALATFVATIFVAKITGAFASILKELKPLLVLLAPLFAALGIPILGTAAVGAALGGLGDPSKSVNGTGGRPDGQMNPGDELPGVGGGSSGGGEGAFDRAKRLGRKVLGALGLGGSGPAIPNSIKMSPEERNTLALIMKYESGGRNVMNHVGASQGLDPETAKGYTAQGYFQMLNSNWRRIAPLLGIKTRNAMASSLEDQARVALYLLRHGGIGNWANYNPALRAAIARGEKIKSEDIPEVAPAPENIAKEPSKPPSDRLDGEKLRSIGAATQGFDPSQYMNAPPVGSTSNDNSVKQQSYKGGDTHVTIHTSGDATETAELWRRHGERAKADDVRYASSVFA